MCSSIRKRVGMESSGGAEGGVSPRPQQRSSRKHEEKQYARKKRAPKRLSQRPNDIYVNRKTEFATQLARCHKLLDQGCNELYIHGLGAAIHRAVNLALQLQETSSHSLQIFTTTSTVELVDDMEPLDDDTEYQTQSRNNSAVHIRLYKNTDESGGTCSKQKT